MSTLAGALPPTVNPPPPEENGAAAANEAPHTNIPEAETPNAYASSLFVSEDRILRDMDGENLPYGYDAVITVEGEDFSESGYATTTAESTKTENITEIADTGITADDIKLKQKRLYHAGWVSAGLSLIYAGGSLWVALNYPGYMLTVLRWSPVMLAMLGLELLIGVIARRKIKISAGSWIACGAVIALSYGLAAAAINLNGDNLTTTKRENNVERRIHIELLNSLGADLAKFDEIISLQAEFTLFGDLAEYHGYEDLKQTDAVDLSFELALEENSPRAMARTASRILAALLTRDEQFGTIYFASESGFNVLRLTVDARFGMQLTQDDLLPMVVYFLSDDVEDLTDLTEE